ncbi:MAG: sodium:solute symporter family protein [Limisphaerales bacterium]
MSQSAVNGITLGVLAYILVQFAIGVVVSRMIRTESDYLVAGRRLGLGLAAFSIFATWFGAETCVGGAAKFHEHGVSGGVTDPFGYALALFIMGFCFAGMLRRKGFTTLADLFRQRYSPGVERFAALIMAPTSIFWAAAQIRAFGQVMHATSDFSVTACITFAAGAVILYTCVGGLLADVVTDFVQSLAIVAGLLALGVALFFAPGFELGTAWRAVEPGRLNLFGGEESPWAKLDLWMMTICGSVVAQEIVARILGTRTPSIARNATLIGGALYLVVGLIPAAIGLFGPQLAPGLDDPEHLLPRLAEEHLPGILHIIFVGALVSAILSTVDSTLLAASALVSHNVVVSFKPTMTERQKLLTARLGVVFFGLLAYVLALGAETIFELVQQANGMGSAGILVVMIFGLFTRWGGVLTSATTLAVAFGTWAAGTYLTGWEATYLISLAAALTTYVVGGWLERAKG